MKISITVLSFALQLFRFLLFAFSLLYSRGRIAKCMKRKWKMVYREQLSVEVKIRLTSVVNLCVGCQCYLLSLVLDFVDDQACSVTLVRR